MALAGILRDITMEAPIADQRYLAKHAVGTAMGVMSKGDAGKFLAVHGDSGSIHALQFALGAVAARFGKADVSITQAKQLLRQVGRADLASRLSRLSKGRNASAHPDWGILRAIDAVDTAGGNT